MGIVDYSSVRDIPPKTQGNRGIFPSSKVPEGSAQYESQIERDFFLLLEHAPDITIFQHQPKTIVYKDEEGKTHKYTPDVYLEFDNGTRVLVEIKDEVSLYKDYEENKLKWDAAEKWCRSKGITFLVLSDRDIRNARLANIWFTYGSSKVQENNKYMNKLLALLSSKPKKYNNLCYELAEIIGSEITKAAQIICYAIYHGIVFVETFSNKKLSRNTLIRRKTGDISSSPFQPLWMELDIALDQREKRKQEDEDDELHTIKSLSTLDDIQNQQELDERLIVVKNWLKQPSHKRTPQWREDFYKKWDVTKSTIYRWVKQYKQEGRDGLIPKYQDRGQNSPYDSEAYDYFEKARKEYLKPSSTFNNAYDKLQEVWKHPDLDLPSKAMLEKYIYNNSTSSELALNKRGRRFHKSNYTPSLGSFQGAIMPMQVLQFDNTPFDVFPVDSVYREPLATPHLTAAIDCYTRMITGFYLSLSSSSSQTVLETLVQSILPKSDYEEMYNTQSIWPIDGFPVIILVDNGMDYRSNAVKEFCTEYDIILEFAPIRTPRYKAYIEQWFRILHHALNDENVGGLRPLLKRRLENPDLDPQGEAILTTQEINEWLHTWIVDKYHFTNPYDDLQPAPYLRWDRMTSCETELILPKAREAPKDEWEIDLMHLHTLNRYERVLHGYGVRWQHLKYQGTELASLFGKIGPGHKVTLLIDRRDIRVAWLLNPIDDRPMRVGLGSGWAASILEIYGDQPILASAWKEEIKSLRERNISDITPHRVKMEKSKELRQKSLRESRKATKTRRKRIEKIRESQKLNIKNKLSNDDNSTEITGSILDIEDELDDYESSEPSKMSGEDIEAFETEDDNLREAILRFSRRRNTDDSE